MGLEMDEDRGCVAGPPVRSVDRASDATDPFARRPSRTDFVAGAFRVLGILSIAVGALLLLETMGILDGVHKLWPVFPAFVGFGLLLLHFRRGRGDILLFGMGSYILSVSAVFFACNFASWEILSSAWPLFITLLGLSSALASISATRARRALWLSGLFLIIVSVILYLVFAVNAKLWPTSLVLFGAWVLLVTWARRDGGRS